MDKVIINGMWIGENLSKIELLTINSFLDHGHVFRLWAYDQIKTELPPNILLEDATKIIPRDQVFSYKNSNSFGHGMGSVAGFSDIFRYKLLYEYGGWWVDMDVCCLRLFDFKSEYVFRKHHELNVVGNVLKCPPNSELMKSCYEEGIQRVDENNTDWHKPIEILNSNIQKLNLEKYILSDLSIHDRWDEVYPFLKKTRKIPPGYYFIHWLNEEWRSKGLNKNDIKIRSTLGVLMQEHKLIPKNNSTTTILKNSFTHSNFYCNLKMLNVIDSKLL